MSFLFLNSNCLSQQRSSTCFALINLFKVARLSHSRLLYLIPELYKSAVFYPLIEFRAITPYFSKPAILIQLCDQE